MSNVLLAQTNKDKLVSKKRAIYIMNIAEQVSGYKKNNKRFVIGVLQDKTIARSLLMGSLNRKINGKPIDVKLTDNLNHLNDFDLLYAKKSSGFEIEQILLQIEKSSTLLISENYNFEPSMINISNLQEDFIIDVNVNRMARYGFSPSSSLLESSIKSAKNWKQLYARTKVVAQEQKQILEEQQKELKEQRKEVFIKKIESLSKDLKIEEEQKRVENLKELTKAQHEKFTATRGQLKELENRYSIQKALVNSKEKEILSQKSLIDKQNEFLKTQERQIQLQKEILGEQQEKLSLQQKINWLLLSLILLILLFLFYFYKTRQKQRRLIKDLEQKNTEIAKKSKILTRQNNELEQFAFIASHDLQEPLHTVTSFSNFLLEDYYDQLDDMGKENLVYIKEGCDRMSILIRSLLEYSRIGSNRKLEVIDSTKLLHNIIKNFNATINETGAKIILGVMPEIKGYRLELGLLFQNLISNAIKFRKHNQVPIVHIHGKKLPETDNYKYRWEFHVKDNGIGISEKHQNEIFNIFKRLHARDEYEGTGIGLAHCKKIIGFHHGDIYVKSKKGVGSTFSFTIQFKDDLDIIEGV
ncbi:YfiR/HmsC family protein [Aquimarina agarilytica]|uniref:YfiR/HmsC family protein n=1 Tax=Aquimarina agarilytica TaxID=1087449 RepID=UPI001E341EE8|nr:YfiR/HmsC family protein [Aquimarina agarilytica]